MLVEKQEITHIVHLGSPVIFSGRSYGVDTVLGLGCPMLTKWVSDIQVKAQHLGGHGLLERLIRHSSIHRVVFAYARAVKRENNRRNKC